jgi:predicted metal-dependent hydrolase
VDHENAAVAAILAKCAGKEVDAHYLAFFECFNGQLYFEAHEVLEHIWLPQRNAPNGLFYKGLIQLAGAFVHVQKGRPGPADALFKLSGANLEKYAPIFERLDLRYVLEIISLCRRTLESDGRIDLRTSAPTLNLEGLGAGGALR